MGMSLPRGRGGALGDLGGLRLQPLVGLGDVDDETGVRTAADRLEVVLGGYVETDPATVHRGDGSGDLDRHAGQRRRRMLERGLDADRVLARLREVEQEIAAGMLDVAAKLRGAIDAARLAHEADSAVAADNDAFDL